MNSTRKRQDKHRTDKILREKYTRAYRSTRKEYMERRRIPEEWEAGHLRFVKRDTAKIRKLQSYNAVEYRIQVLINNNAETVSE